MSRVFLVARSFDEAHQPHGDIHVHRSRHGDRLTLTTVCTGCHAEMVETFAAGALIGELADGTRMPLEAVPDGVAAFVCYP